VDVKKKTKKAWGVKWGHREEEKIGEKTWDTTGPGRGAEKKKKKNLGKFKRPIAVKEVFNRRKQVHLEPVSIEWQR